MAKQQYRVAIIGAGKIVQVGHIPNFQSIPNVTVAALCDVNEERVKAIAAEKKVPQTFTDYQKMLAEVKPDITVIATPNIFHKPMALAALSVGSHVLCEKPLALSYADAKEMMDLAVSKGLTLTVGSHYRWSDAIRATKAQADAGFFGEIYAVRTVWHRRAGIPGFGSWFTRKELAGGGSLLDIGIHALDRALFIMGYPEPVTVSGVTFAKLGTQGLGLGGWGADIQKPTGNAQFDVDDLSWALIRFANGAVIQLQVSWAVNNKDQFYTEIYGTQGGALVGDQDQLELYTSLNGQQSDIQTKVPRSGTGSYLHLTQNLVRHLDGDPTAEVVTPQQSLTSVKIIEGVLRSAQEGREVELR
ncbi:MAG: Gfo/Idh/MocA family oxidoreductase [Caldilineaceae bacterium]|nr:Gfo/Idh/MocA family oxidoreductase [Caldilineaceae bacterium]